MEPVFWAKQSTLVSTDTIASGAAGWVTLAVYEVTHPTASVMVLV